MIFLVTPKWKVYAMWFIVGATAFGAVLAGKGWLSLHLRVTHMYN
jgi:hypothetical protein